MLTSHPGSEHRCALTRSSAASARCASGGCLLLQARLRAGFPRLPLVAEPVAAAAIGFCAWRFQSEASFCQWSLCCRMSASCSRKSATMASAVASRCCGGCPALAVRAPSAQASRSLPQLEDKLQHTTEITAVETWEPSRWSLVDLPTPTAIFCFLCDAQPQRNLKNRPHAPKNERNRGYRVRLCPDATRSLSSIDDRQSLGSDEPSP
jgi:hypothetical protein